jgi:anti-sigma B factor antagonist
MHLEVRNISERLNMVVLSGRMDMAGAQEIDLKFAAHSAVDGGRLIVDLAGVDFLASIGIRTLVINAKAVSNRHGRMVLLNPAPNVRKVLEMSGIDTLIPMFGDYDAALAAVSAD